MYKQATSLAERGGILKLATMPIAKDKQYLAVHVGPYHMRFVQLAGTETPAVGEPDAWDQVVSTPTSPARFTELVKSTFGALEKKPKLLAVSVPGVVDETSGVGLVSPNLPWLEQFRIGDLFKRESGAEVIITHEVRALARGHAATTDDRDFLLVDFGSGMSSAIVLDGKLIKAALPVSGEIGHMQVPGVDRRCGCGANGCVETLMSRAGLLNDLSAQVGRKIEKWEEMEQHVAARGVEPWLQARLTASGRAIASALNVIGVPKVVITGSLVQLPSVVISAIAESTRNHALAARYRQIEVVAAPRQRLAGLLATLSDGTVLS